MTMREDAHAVVEAHEREWADAWVGCHAARCARLLADDFVEVDAHGRYVSKGEWLASLATNAPRQVHWTDGRVRLLGRTAIAYVKLNLSGAMKGREYRSEFAITDIWALHGADWTVISRQVTRVRAA